MNSFSYISDGAVLLLFFVVSFIVVAVREWLLAKKPARVKDKAVLFSYYTTGNSLFSGGRRELKNVKGHASVTTFVTLSLPESKLGRDAVAAPPGRTLLLVELPFRSKLHVVAVTRNGQLEQLNPSLGDSVMNKVELEGDFPNYFTMYIDRDDHLQLRYVFDPKAMAFVVDFCRKYHWEVVDDTIYIASKVGPPSNETLEQFIAEIRPALEDSTNAITVSRYKQKTWPQVSTYKCPVCAESLQEYRHWLECPKGHGQLILGANLAGDEVEKEYKDREPQGSNIEVAHQNITCPVCRKPMKGVQYGGSKVIIDSCTACPYRWLDAGEWAKLIDRVS